MYISLCTVRRNPLNPLVMYTYETSIQAPFEHGDLCLYSMDCVNVQEFMYCLVWGAIPDNVELVACSTCYTCTVCAYQTVRHGVSTHPGMEQEGSSWFV